MTESPDILEPTPEAEAPPVVIPDVEPPALEPPQAEIPPAEEEEYDLPPVAEPPESARESNLSPIWDKPRIGGDLNILDTPDGYSLIPSTAFADDTEIAATSEPSPVLWGQLISDFTYGQYFVVHPADASGSIIDSNSVVGVYVLPDGNPYNMPYSTKVEAGTRIPYVLEGDSAYVLGKEEPSEVIVDLQLDATALQVQVKYQVDFGMFTGTVSEWVDKIAATDCAA